MAEIDVLTQQSLQSSALAAREFVHRLAPSQVLLTDVRTTGPDEFSAAARWPQAFGAGDGGGARHDPLLVAETLRQLGIYLPLHFYGVAADSRLLIEELRFSLDPAGEQCGRAGAEITCTARAVRRNAGGAASGHMRGLDVRVRLHADGREFARADVVARVLCPAAYRAVRHRGHGRAAEGGGEAGAVGAGGAMGAAGAMGGGSTGGSGGGARSGGPGVSGGSGGPGGPSGSSGSGGPGGYGGSSGDGGSGTWGGSGSGDVRARGALEAALEGGRLTAVDPARVGAVRPRDVLVAVDGRGGVRIAPTDPFHPFFHDHLSDHITGMTLVGALQQTAALQANEPRLRLRSCTLRALRFTEPSPPPAVEIGTAGRFEIRQRGSVTATGEAHFEL